MKLGTVAACVLAALLAAWGAVELTVHLRARYGHEGAAAFWFVACLLIVVFVGLASERSKR